MRVVHADDHPARWTGPALLLGFEEMPYAGLAYALEVFNHAHTVPGSVALIEVVQAGAGEALATEAVLASAFGYSFAGLDSACNAGFRFAGVVTPAAGTGLAVPHIGPAEPAVHSARRDQARAKRISSCCSYWRHVRVRKNVG